MGINYFISKFMFICVLIKKLVLNYYRVLGYFNFL